MTPPWRVWPCGLICFFTIFRPSIITLLTCGIARETVPRFPLSFPVMIKTVSPFLIFILARWRGFFSFCFVAIFYLFLVKAGFLGAAAPKRGLGCPQYPPFLPPKRASERLLKVSLKHLRRKRNDLHEVSFAQFAGNRTKDTRASWIITRGNDHGSILVKTDMRTIRPRIFLGHAHYHSINDFSLFDLSIGRSLLHSSLNNIPYLRITFGRTAHYTNTHNLFGTSIISDLQARLWLYHLNISLFFCLSGFTALVDFTGFNRFVRRS